MDKCANIKSKSMFGTSLLSKIKGNVRNEQGVGAAFQGWEIVLIVNYKMDTATKLNMCLIHAFACRYKLW